MDRKMNKLFFIFIFILLVVPSVLALGLTPGRTTFDYTPGSEEKVSFSVINSEGKDIDLVVLIQGELNRSISVSEVSFSMLASEESKEIFYTLEISEDLSPGEHSAEVVVVQLPGKSATSEAFVGSAVGVATQIRIFVPYPGKYAEASLNVIGPGDSGEVTFVMPVLNRGDLDIVRARGVVDIYGPLNEKVKTLQTNEVSIESKSRKELAVKWTPEVSSGTYRAVATVIYDEQTLTLEKQFNVGTRLLEIQNIEVNDFSLGDIAKFEMLVENKWSELISGAYAQMMIYNDEGEVMADFKSSTYDLPSLEKILMVAFWDTEGVKKGNYDSSVFLRYGSQSVEKNLELKVSDNEINIVGVGYVISENRSSGGTNTLMIVLITVIVVLVLINLLWFLVLRKKLSGKKK